MLLWGVLSLTAGLVLLIDGNDFWRAFGLQAVLWGAIEAAIALFSQRRPRRKLDLRVDLREADAEAAKLRRSLLIDCGLDGIYLAAAAGLLIFGKNNNSLMTGSAWSIAVQGMFLLVFDLLHAINVPAEYVIPDLGIFGEYEHRAGTLEKGKPAILLVHGFPGTPKEMLSLGEALYQQGWTVRIMCLPGHGSAYRSLLQTRAVEWERAVQEELRVLQVMHVPVLLLGYSLGAGLSIPAAVELNPDGLILLAPFWIEAAWWLKPLIWLARPFLPVSINLFTFVRPDTPQLRAALAEIAPDFDFTSPVIQAAMREFRLPVIFAEQLCLMSRWVYSSAASIRDIPVLIAQAKNDQIVRTHATQKLLLRIPTKVTYVEVPGDHNLNLKSHPGYPQIEKAVLDFTVQFLERAENP